MTDSQTVCIFISSTLFIPLLYYWFYSRPMSVPQERYKNIVVVGGSSGGANVVKHLRKSLPAEYRIILIDKSPKAYWPIASLRAAVQEGWQEKLYTPFTQIFAKGEPHIVIADTTVMDLEHDWVTIDPPHQELGSVIEFEYAVVATGAIYSTPCRPQKSVEETFEVLEKYRDGVKEADKIVIVGGGPVGIEFAGEILHQYPDKAVTLLHSGGQLVSNSAPQAFHKKLFRQLEAAGVEVILRVKADVQGLESGLQELHLHLNNGETISGDFLFLATGNKQDSSLFSKLDESLVEGNGAVKVTSTLQLPGYDNIFAVGDVTNTQEAKTSVTASAQAAVAAKNVVAKIKGRGLADYKVQTSLLMLVTFGPKGGAATTPVGVLGPLICSILKSRSLFIGMFERLYKA
ncbi:Apoptosis-inducing factor A [Neolecta irregularis DAH-3]|uniref:Apoptosis-inducing factor A n=1 Tax=Neolecta irregularis (strain DAH-3) TaxID=1198029 RepID=A0A1U7LK43_NEOID|nr:Apoptosis-inducing factor A [Neolecta irregularis DAH-3]|eukprot:OLL23009.1 Apoptosis-inducing factor A [Neolecta irregularis DAH-3]